MTPETNRYLIGPLTVCASQGVVLVGSEILDLAPKTVSVLLVLTKAPGAVVSREALREAVWGDAIVEEAVISRNISLLRSKLRPYLGDTEIIETIPKRGYRFIVPVSRLNGERPDLHSFQEAPQPLVAAAVAATPADSPAISLRRHRTARWTVLSLVALLVAVFAIFFRSYLYPAPQPTLALLHIQDISQEQSTAWIGVLLETDLRAELAAGRGAIMPDAATTFAAEHDLGPHSTINKVEAYALGQKLNTRLLLTGNYVAPNGQVRVDLTLREAATGNVTDRWTATVPQSQLHNLVQNAAVHLRKVLHLKPTDTPAAPPFFTANQFAAQQYAEAMALSQSGDNGPGEVELLRNAVRADPAFARAHAALSVALTRLGQGQAADDEARLALATASKLPLEERLLCQATAYSQLADYPHAVGALTYLHHRYPANLDYTMRLADQLINFGKLDQASDLLIPLAAPATGRPPDARVLLALAQISQLRGDVKNTILDAGRARAQGVADGSRSEQAKALEISGESWSRLRDCDRAQTELNQAQTLFTAIGDRESMVLNLFAQAYAAEVCGDPSALKTTRFALTAAEDLNRQDLIARGLKSLGILQIANGDDEAAIRSYRQAVQLAGAVHDWNVQMLALYDLGTAEIGTLDIDAAVQHTQQALALARLTGSTMGIARATLQLADLEALQGKLDLAINHYRQGINVLSQMGQMTDVNDRLYSIGNLLLAEGKLSEAQTVFRGIDLNSLSVANLSLLKVDNARLAAAMGDVSGAESLARDADASAVSPDHRILALDLLADLQLRTHDLRSARITFAEMSKQLKLVPTDRDSVHLVDLLSARLDIEAGDTDRAQKSLAALLREAAICRDKELQLRVKIVHSCISARKGRGNADLQAAIAEARQSGFVLLAESTALPAS